MKKYELNEWVFSKNEKSKKWMPACVPGTVHTDLLNNDVIKEPFLNDNETALNWICETEWIYKTEFDLPSDFEYNKNTYLVFEGVDTIADAILNGKKILTANNMFLKYETEITKQIKQKNNKLELVFQSPVKYAKSIESKYGKLPVALNSERAYIRKAQYSFGWDWGPSFPTSGIWRPVFLLQKNKAEIKNVYFETKSITKKYAAVLIEFCIEVNGKTDGMNYTLSMKNGAVDVNTAGKITKQKKQSVLLEINNPMLWYPSGEGEQNLYELSIVLKDGNNDVINEATKKIGLRTIDLQLKDGKENTFRLVVNGKPLFAKGTNWIPSDTFLPRTAREKYYKLLKAAKDSNQNIIRVWGGGIYENDLFYEICDELGLMVWHDFMFACGAYPENKEFINNISREVTQNVKRLQHHACIALWCGNNENEWIWYQDYKSSYTNMPGYKIFSKIIPGILAKEDPNRIYWESSPFGFDDDPNSANSGNRHQWQIWSMWTDYREVVKDESLFVTEFGFQGPANISALEKYISKEHRAIQSRVFEFHNKQIEGNERLIRFLAGHLPLNTGWHDFIYLAQLNQGLALKTCLEHWRGNYPKTNGALIWQLNDCWPVTSWSLIDSESEPKPAYYFVKNAFAQILLIVKTCNNNCIAELHNSWSAKFEGRLVIQKINSVSGSINAEIQNEVIISAGKKITTVVSSVADIAEDEIIVASLYSKEGILTARNYYIKSEWKYFKLGKTRIKCKLKKASQDKYDVILNADKPAYFVDLYHPDGVFNDRDFMLLPGEEKKMEMISKSGKRVSADEIKIFCLNDYLL